jgi:hypothetical protein
MTQMTKAVQMRVVQSLQDIGFRKSGLFSVCDFGGGYAGSIGVNAVVRPMDRVLSITPSVGVIHWETERLWAEFRGRPAKETPAATVFTNIGYLTPADVYRGYVLEPTADPADTIREIISDVQTYALPWMHDLCDMEKLTALAEKDSPDHAAYRVPILRALQGQPEKALAAMEYYKGRRTHVPAFLERYAKFEVWFQERLLSRP